jgi:cellulose biosynthesis protein BcsQ
VLEGRVWFDETFYTVRSEDIKLKPDGSKPRGLSENQICVGVACTKEQILCLMEGKGQPTARKAYMAFKDHIAPGSTLVHDNGKAHGMLIKALELVDEARRDFKLKDALDKISDDYDIIIIDCPPSLGLVTINCLIAAEGVIIPLLCEFYSLEGLSQLTNTINQINKRYNSKLVLLGVLINMYDGRLNLTHQVMNEIKKYFSDKLFKTPIPRNVKLSEAPSYGMPISEYDRYSKGAMAYESFTRELLDRMKKY